MYLTTTNRATHPSFFFSRIDYYGVTFDHFVRADDPNPEVLAINIIEVDKDGGAFANEVLSFPIDVAEFVGEKVLAVPRCCQIKKGTQDRGRINGLVAERDRIAVDAERGMRTGAVEAFNYVGENLAVAL